MAETSEEVEFVINSDASDRHQCDVYTNDGVWQERLKKGRLDAIQGTRRWTVVQIANNENYHFTQHRRKTNKTADGCTACR